MVTYVPLVTSVTVLDGDCLTNCVLEVRTAVKLRLSNPFVSRARPGSRRRRTSSAVICAVAPALLVGGVIAGDGYSSRSDIGLAADAGVTDVDIEPLASMVAWTIERTISMYALDHPESDDPALAAEVVDTGRRAVLVSRAALARTAHPEAAPGVLDEATELPTFGDVLEPWGTPDDGAVALVVDGTPLEVHGAPITTDVEPGARVHLVDPSTAELLVVAGAAWAAGGSVVLSLGTDEDVLEHRAAIERVDARIG